VSAPHRQIIWHFFHTLCLLPSLARQPIGRIVVFHLTRGKFCVPFCEAVNFGGSTLTAPWKKARHPASRQASFLSPLRATAEGPLRSLKPLRPPVQPECLRIPCLSLPAYYVVRGPTAYTICSSLSKSAVLLWSRLPPTSRTCLVCQRHPPTFLPTVAFSNLLTLDIRKGVLAAVNEPGCWDQASCDLTLHPYAPLIHPTPRGKALSLYRLR